MIKDFYLSKPGESIKSSVIIPSWNNLSFLQLCVKSIQEHSTYDHQIIVHINEGSDGTLEWVKSQPELSYTYSEQNIGVCYALNAMRSLVKGKYMVFVNDDMYLLPEWDLHFWNVIGSRKDDLFFYSATGIEPKFTSNHSVIAPADYGHTVEDFKEERLLKEYKDLSKEDWSGATWPPNVIATRVWDLVGGYSTEFSPGMYSDPDFSRKLWEAGVRDFRGIAASRAYHFMSKTVGRIKKNNGSKQFLMKWGITSSMFVKFFLRRGQPYQGLLTTPELTGAYKKKLYLTKFKKVFST